ncbi:MAG: molybdenum cofactor guanylyltransferase [Solirubrobacteraceae bacterium]|nr:molybdenum cofactor guanylyltransferase [Solirubrobacteraceae bacterium]
MVGAIVLAGGRSSRMGTAKASLEWHGSTLLRRVAGLVERSVDGPVVIVRSVGQPLPELPASWEVVDDVHPGRGPLEGLAAGLRALGDRAELAYASSTDVPFLHTSFVGAVVGGIDPGHEICVPVVGRRWQPLAAVYRTSLLPVLEDLLAAGERRVSRLFDRCQVNGLDRAALLANPGIAAGDPELESLVNLNDPQAYAQARGRPAPVIAVSWGRRPPSGRGSPIDSVRAATLGGLAETAGLILGGGVRVELNRRSVRPDPELPLERGDAVVFERA